MKRITNIPTKNFILQLLSDASITKLTEHMNIDNEIIVKEIVDYYKRLGIHEINPVTHKQLILNSVKAHLTNNPSIITLVIENLKAQEELMSRRKRQTPGT